MGFVRLFSVEVSEMVFKIVFWTDLDTKLVSIRRIPIA